MRIDLKNIWMLSSALLVISVVAANCVKPLPREAKTSDNGRSISATDSDQMDISVIFPVGEDNVVVSSPKQSIKINIGTNSRFDEREINDSEWSFYRGPDTLTSCADLSTQGNENWDFIGSTENIIPETFIDISEWETGVYYLCFYSESLPLEFKTGALRVSRPGVPLAPTALTGELKSVNAVLLKWKDNANDELEFIIERTVDQLEWVEVGRTLTDVLEFSDQNVIPESSYFYRVKSRNLLGSSPPSGSFEITIAPEGIQLASPVDLMVTAKTYTTINLSWVDASENNTGIRLERSLDGTSGWTVVGNFADATTSYQDTTLSQNTDYFYRALATKGATKSEPSAMLKVTTYGPPVALGLLGTSSMNQKIGLSWEGESEVLIVKSTIGSTVNWTPTDYVDYNLGPVDANNTLIYKGSAGTFENSGLTNGEVQYYAAFVDNGLKEYSTPTKAAVRPNGILSFGMGNFSMCVNTTDENVYCWGFNGNGFVGDADSPNNKNYPVPVDTAWMQDHDSGSVITIVKKFNQIGARGFSSTVCATGTDGFAYCWGFNGDKQLGNSWHSAGGSHRVYMAVDNNGTSFNKVFGGPDVSCGTDTANNGYCWGANFGDMVGNNTLISAEYDSAQPLTTSSKFLDFAFTQDAVCGLTTTSSIECWGSTVYGSAGQPSGANLKSPTPISLSRTWVQLTGGSGHFCALDDGGRVYCWGSDYLGEIGDGDRDLDLDPADGDTPTPTQPDLSGTGINSFKAVAAIDWGTCAVTDANKIFCWGREFLKPMASSVNFYKPTELFTTGLPPNFDVKSMQGTYNDDFSGNVGGKLCLLLTTDELYCTGYGLYGQLGQGNVTDYLDRFVRINLITAP